MKKVVLMALLAAAAVSVSFGSKYPSKHAENKCVEDCEKRYVIDKVENGLEYDIKELEKCFDTCDE